MGKKLQYRYSGVQINFQTVHDPFHGQHSEGRAQIEKPVKRERTALPTEKTVQQKPM